MTTSYAVVTLDPLMVLWLTDFGDSGFILMLTAAAACFLTAWKYPKAGFTLLLCVMLAGLLIGVAKLYFLSCHSLGKTWYAIRSPSGHACISAAFYLALARGLTPVHERGKMHVFVYLIAIIFTLAIAWSRLWLGLHTFAEIAVGYVLGIIAYGVIYLLYARKHSRPPRRLQAFTALALVVLAFTIHGTKSHVEQRMQSLSLQWRSYVAPLCFS